jgi:dihydrolipoamide dehydrogenase
LVERSALGGVCLNVGCIPTKSLVATARLWRRVQQADRFGIRIPQPPVLDWAAVLARNSRIIDTLRTGLSDLLRREGVERIEGDARLTDARTLSIEGASGKRSLAAGRMVLALGASPATGPWQLDEKFFLSYKGLLSRPTLPKSLLIIGGGVIGCEFASIFATFGSAVTLIEQQEQILPSEDPEIVRWLLRRLESLGVRVLAGTAIGRLDRASQGVSALLADGTTFQAECALISIGNRPNGESLGLSQAGIGFERGITVDDYLLTAQRHIAAIGDCLPGRGLAHWASAEGRLAVENLLGDVPARLDAQLIPRCAYTDPEIASIGRPTLPAEGIRISRLSFGAVSKSVCDEETEGVVKLAVLTATDRVVGAGIVGAGASELIHPVALAMRHGLTARQMADTITAHPSLPEAVTEAAAHIYGASLCVFARAESRAPRAQA